MDIGRFGTTEAVPLQIWSGAGIFWLERGDALVLDEVHSPAGDDDGAYQEAEAEGSEADHHLGGGALGDAEDHGDAEREDKHGGEVRQH